MKLYCFVNGNLDENCYVIGDDNFEYCYIIDPGEDPNQTIEAAKKFKEVKGILLTHGHFDHCSGTDKVFNRFKTKVYMNLLDIPYIDGTFVKTNVMPEYFLSTIKSTVYPCFDLDDENIVIYETPGHTKGSVSYYFKNENIMFTGDALFKNSVGRTDLPLGSARDSYDTIKLFKSLKNDIKVYPGHGQETTIGEEKECNPFFIGV